MLQTIRFLIMTYLLDANVFIEANKRYYSKEIVPSFWEFLEKDNDVFTINKVKEEIKAGKDELVEFIDKIKICDKGLNNHASDIAEYIYQTYDPEKSNDFLNKADFPLACIAKANNFIVVTHEKLLGANAEKVTIPNICKNFDIGWMNTFQMLKAKKIDLSNYQK